MPRSLNDDPLQAKIEFRCSSALEMLSCLHVIQDPVHHPAGLEWSRRAGALLHPGARAEIEYFDRRFNRWLAPMDLVAGMDLPPGRSPREVLAAIQAMDEDHFVRLMSGGRLEGAGCPVEDPPADFPGLAELSANPGAVRHRLVACLEEFLGDVFEREIPAFEEAILARIQELSRVMEEKGAFDVLEAVSPRVVVDRERGIVVCRKQREVVADLAALRRIVLAPLCTMAPHLLVSLAADELWLHPDAAPVPRRPASGGVPAELRRLLAALADESRLRLLYTLSRNERCTRELARELGLAEATVSRHLKRLEEARLAEARREGNFVYYRAVAGVPERLRAWLSAYLG